MLVSRCQMLLFSHAAAAVSPLPCHAAADTPRAAAIDAGLLMPPRYDAFAPAAVSPLSSLFSAVGCVSLIQYATRNVRYQRITTTLADAALFDVRLLP